MSKKIIILKLLIVSFCFNVFAYKQEFVPGTSDLPVIKNFSLISDSAHQFVTDEGKLIEAQYKGRGTRENILNFYKKTLKSLGWEKEQDNIFIRDGQQLKIFFHDIEDENFHNLELYFVQRPINYSTKDQSTDNQPIQLKTIEKQAKKQTEEGLKKQLREQPVQDLNNSKSKIQKIKSPSPKPTNKNLLNKEESFLNKLETL